MHCLSDCYMQIKHSFCISIHAQLTMELPGIVRVQDMFQDLQM